MVILKLTFKDKMSVKEIVNCPNCFTCIKKKGCFEKHILYCDRELAFTKTPTNTQLMNMITNLTDKYNEVQKELQSIKNQIYTKNRKMDVLKWLNDSSITNTTNSSSITNSSISHDDVSFVNAFDDIDISIEDLNFIFDSNYINGVCDIMKKHLSNHYEIDSIIRCFNQKKYILYVYNGDKWIILENEEFINIIKHINTQLFNAFKQYRKLNVDKLHKDNFHIKFNANSNKLLCANIPFDVRCTRIKNKIYAEYKVCFTSVTSLDI